MAEVRLHAGDRVLVRAGDHRVEATVVEDRGDFGLPKHQIVRVSWQPTDVDEPQVLEVASTDLEPAT